MTLWNFFRSFINGLTIIITLLNFFFKINAINDLIKDTWFEKAILNNKYTNYVVIVVLGLCFILFLISIYCRSRKNVVVNKRKHEFFHELRNCTFSARDVTKDSKDSYNKVIVQSSEKLCEGIARYFEEKYNKSFNICIKTLDISSSIISTSIKDIKVVTLARGGKDKQQRELQDPQEPVLVKDDTSYFQILSNEDSGKRSYYSCSNLAMQCLMGIAIKRPYLPSFRTFYKKYLSTVVVPIRIDSAVLPDESKYLKSKNRRYQVFGFLCLDYKTPISKNLSKCISEDLKSFADGLYIFYDEVIKANITYELNVVSDKIALAVDRK